MAKCLSADERLRRWLLSSEITQADIAEIIGVSRTAVSKWVSGHMYPSEQHANELDELSQGAVPATEWPRRTLPAPQNRGARVLQDAAETYGGSIRRLAHETGLPQRGLSRWASNVNAPRKKALVKINAALKTNLRVEDFQVGA